MQNPEYPSYSPPEQNPPGYPPQYPPQQYPPQYPPEQYPPQQYPPQQYPPQQYPPQQYPPQQYPPNYQQQPQPAQQTTVIVSQQAAAPIDQGPQRFKNDLCGCMKNCPICLLSCCFPCFLIFNHSTAISRATNGSTSCIIACLLDLIYCCCLNRQALRNAYKIQGSLLEDCFYSIFCTFCALMQEYYEAQDRG